jgi:hypothetical protein
MRKCPCAQWRDLKDRILAMHLQMCNDPIIKKMQPEAKKYFDNKAFHLIG